MDDPEEQNLSLLTISSPPLAPKSCSNLQDLQQQQQPHQQQSSSFLRRSFMSPPIAPKRRFGANPAPPKHREASPGRCFPLKSNREASPGRFSLKSNRAASPGRFSLKSPRQLFSRTRHSSLASLEIPPTLAKPQAKTVDHEDEDVPKRPKSMACLLSALTTKAKNATRGRPRSIRQ